MHHALEIEELLSNIFQYCIWQRRDLASLAITCRAFNEPATAILWSILDDLSVLAKCVPEASTFQIGDTDDDDDEQDHYTFHRSLTLTEWNFLYSRTRYIRRIDGPGSGLDEQSLKVLSKPSITETLFPNVRYLLFDAGRETGTSWSLFPFPSLHELLLYAFDPHLFGNYLESLHRTSPNLARLSVFQDDDADLHIDPDFLCPWQNLQTVDCPQVPLNHTTLVHLSCRSMLVELSFTLCNALFDQISLSDPPLVFSNLCKLHISSESLSLLSHFLFRTRLPAVTKFVVGVKCGPSKEDCAAFLSKVQTSGVGHTIEELRLSQKLSHNPESLPLAHRHVLRVEDLEPCMAFGHLHCLRIDCEFEVDLTARDLLRLTSAWPQLTDIDINPNWGWKSHGGITPNELVDIVRARPTLTHVSIAMDTRGYTKIPLPPPSSLPRLLRVNVVDSSIEAESVTAIVAFFANVIRCVYINYCWHPRGGVVLDRWNDIRKRVKDKVIHAMRKTRGAGEPAGVFDGEM